MRNGKEHELLELSEEALLRKDDIMDNMTASESKQVAAAMLACGASRTSHSRRGKYLAATLRQTPLPHVSP
jgi:hypothetical protein